MKKLLIIAAFSFYGCISKPDYIENEPAICRDAKYIAYAFNRSDKVPETVISNGLASCRNIQLWLFCREQAKPVENQVERERFFQQCWDKTKQQ